MLNRRYFHTVYVNMNKTYNKISKLMRIYIKGFLREAPKKLLHLTLLLDQNKRRKLYAFNNPFLGLFEDQFY